jgi:hypothetical protein
MLSRPHYLPKLERDAQKEFLRPAEILLMGFILSLAAVCVIFTSLMGRHVDWQGFSVGIGAAFMLMVIGIYVRVVKSAPRLALCAIGVGIFMSFSALIAIFIFSLFPLTNPLIDRQLIVADATLGYNWVDFSNALAVYPVVGKALALLYNSAIPQMVLVILLLGILGRETHLHRFLLVGVLAMLTAVGFWWFFPTIGPPAYTTLPAGVADRIGLVTTPEYGAHLMDLVRNGLPVIRPRDINGAICFPSYHMIMALMVAWFSFRTILFPPLALASLFMMPAALVHGGHHLLDLAGGLLVFLTCVWIAGRLVPASVQASDTGA